ncbi:hypothetical protein WH47_12567 [Habropoda laboriosa]|uniref:Uncharacterized protein n=1 Tax=Habropoda laboriosa TaxID=597456 RepID=A0A0L7QKM8_9HYME|nr:hypothetical protein WH47_12567 [Habropoda laboriosa]
MDSTRSSRENVVHPGRLTRYGTKTKVKRKELGHSPLSRGVIGNRLEDRPMYQQLEREVVTEERSRSDFLKENEGVEEEKAVGGTLYSGVGKPTVLLVRASSQLGRYIVSGNWNTTGLQEHPTDSPPKER